MNGNCDSSWSITATRNWVREQDTRCIDWGKFSGETLLTVRWRRLYVHNLEIRAQAMPPLRQTIFDFLIYVWQSEVVEEYDNIVENDPHWCGTIFCRQPSRSDIQGPLTSTIFVRMWPTTNTT